MELLLGLQWPFVCIYSQETRADLRIVLIQVGVRQISAVSVTRI